MGMILKPRLGIKPNWGHPLTKGLVGCWLFNEAPGKLGKVYDLSGNGNHGTLVADTHSVPGLYGPALSFDGTGDYVDCGTGTGNLLGSTKNVSYSCWFKSNYGGQNAGILYTGTLASSYGEMNIQQASSRLYLRMNAIAFNYYVAFTDTTSWHHVVATYDGIKGRLYLDNELVIDQAYTATLDFANLKTVFGLYYDTLTFNGQIDHVMIWNRALSASEVAQSYQEPFRMFEVDL